MKRNYLFLLFMFVVVNVFAQTYDVTINVTDAMSMSNIETADVTFDATTLQTDVNGDVTFSGIADGTYAYSISVDCYESTSGSIDVMGANVNESYGLNLLTSANVFVGSSSNMFGTFAEGDITLTDGVNTYNKSVTEFDNLVTGVVFGTYDYTFTRAGACDVTGTVDVQCSTLDAMSGNVPLFFLSEDKTSGDVFVGSSSNMFGTFAEGDITLTDGVNTYNKSVTEFDNLVTGVVFGTYDYTFTRAGACDVTGTVDVQCSTLDAMSGNVPLFFLSEDATAIDDSVMQADQVLTANQTGASYQWIDCNNGNTPIDGATNQTYTATANGSYAVIITIGNCEATSLCYDVTTLSIDSFDSSLSLKVYPNPVVNNMTISLNKAFNAIHVQVYSTLGQLVKTIKMTNKSSFEVNMSDVSLGTYLMKINADGKTNTRLIVKK